MPRDPRPYITVATGIPEHPKVEALSDKAFRLLIETWCYCSRNDTDGHVTEAAWRRRGTPRARQELVDAGLASTSSTGVWMHDYLKHQTSAADRAALRDKRASAGKLGGQARANRQASATASAKQAPGTLLSKTQAELELEEEVLEKTPSSPAAAAAETTPRRKVGTRIDPHLDPDGHFPVTDDMRTWAAQHAPFVRHPGRETEQFADYWSARTGKDATKLDWRKTWQTWMRTAQTRAEKGATLAPVRTLRPGAVQR